MSALETVVAILGLAAVTLLSRAAFLLPGQALQLPDRVKRHLRHAPLAALVAICVPEVVMSQGELVHTVLDARILGAVAGLGYFAWRRGILGTIVAGMAVFLPLRILWGW